MKYAYLLILALLFSPLFAYEASAQGGWWDSVLEERDGRSQRRGGVERNDREDERRRFPRRERSRHDEGWEDDRGWGDEDDRDEDDRDEDEWDEDEWDEEGEGRWDRRRGDRGRGPVFCRNGRGHPVFGMEWCRDKGWGDRNDRWDDRDDRWDDRDDRWGDRNDRWERNRDWGDIIFGEPRRSDRRGNLNENVLEDILGGVFLSRLEAYGRALDLGSDVEGRWVNGSGRTRILQLRADGHPLAELADYDGDGRVDVAVMARR